MSSISCLLGILNASVSASALRITKNFILSAPSVGQRLLVGLAPFALLAQMLLGDAVLEEIRWIVGAAHLEFGAVAHRRLAGPGQRLVQRLHLDDPEAGNQLLGLGERTVDDDALAVLELDLGP